MKSQFEYYEEIKRTFPHTMSKDQFYRVAHIAVTNKKFIVPNLSEEKEFSTIE